LQASPFRLSHAFFLPSHGNCGFSGLFGSERLFSEVFKLLEKTISDMISFQELSFRKKKDFLKNRSPESWAARLFAKPCTRADPEEYARPRGKQA
jgi:hypothetical protein